MINEALGQSATASVAMADAEDATDTATPGTEATPTEAAAAIHHTDSDSEAYKEGAFE